MSLSQTVAATQAQRIQRWAWGLAAVALGFFVLFITFCIRSGTHS